MVSPRNVDDESVSVSASSDAVGAACATTWAGARSSGISSNIATAPQCCFLGGVLRLGDGKWVRLSVMGSRVVWAFAKACELTNTAGSGAKAVVDALDGEFAAVESKGECKSASAVCGLRVAG